MDPNLMQAIMSDPELMSLMSRPGVMQKLQEIMQDPQKAALYANDPDLQTIMRKLSDLGLGPSQPTQQFSPIPTSSSRVHPISSEQEFNALLQNSGDSLIVVDWFTTWCGPCKAIAPAIESMASVYPDVKFVKVDCDRLKPLAMQRGVQAYPTFHLYRQGMKVDEMRGANARGLEQLVVQHSEDSEEKDQVSPYKNFPLLEDELVKYDSVKYEMVQAKIEEANEAVGNELKLSENEMEGMRDILNILSVRHSYLKTSFDEQHFQIILKLLNWPMEYVVPAINIPRMLVFHPSAAKYMAKNDSIISRLEEIILKKDSPPIVKLLVLQSFVNMFNKRILFPTLIQNSEKILNATASCVNESSKKLRTTYMSLLINFAIFFRICSETSSDSKIQCLSSVMEVLSSETANSSVIYRALIVVGTLIYQDEEVKIIASTLDLDSLLQRISGHVTEPSSKQTIEEISKSLANDEF